MKESKVEKDKFFSKISHDLRGSFTSILGFSDILNDPSENLTKDEISEFSSRIASQSKETFDLLVNFVNWLKLENYEYGLTPEKNEILEMFYEVQSLHQKKISKKEVKINYKISHTETVFLDYEILKSIVNNILFFVIKSCCNNTDISISSLNNSEKFITIEIITNCSEENSTFLQNLKITNIRSDFALPLVFAIKFIELSGGFFDFKMDLENKLLINFQLPKK